MKTEIHVSRPRKSFLFCAAGLAAALSGCSSGGDSGGGTASQALAYGTDGFVYLTGVAAPVLEPSVEPSGAATYSVAPALPPGLSLDPATGEIGGEPSAALAPATYVVTASTGSGQASATLELEVRDRFAAPRFAYTLDWDGARIQTWRVDSESGALEPTGSTPSDSFPFRAVPDPLGRFLYVSHFGTGTLGAYRIDPQSGALALVQLLPVGTAAFELVMSPNGRFLVVADIGADLIASFAIDADSGFLSPAAGAVAFTDPSGLTINDAGDRLFAASLTDGLIASYSMDRETGAIIAQLDVEATPGPVGLALTPDETALFTANSGLDALTSFTVDQSSGDLGPLTSIFSGEEPVAISVDEDGNRLSVANLGGRRIESFDINPDRSLTLVDVIDLAGSAVSLVELEVGDALLAPLFDEGLVSATLPGATAGSFVPGPLRPALGRPSDLAVVFSATPASRSPRHVYAANLTAGDVTPLGWDPVGETLDPVGPSVPTGGKPSGLSLSADGLQLYVADQLDQAVVALDRDSIDGSLVATAKSAPAGALARAVAVGPDGSQVLAIGNDGVTQFSTNPDGSLAVLGTAAAGLAPDDLAIAPDGRHAFVANRNSGDVSAFWITDGLLAEVAGSPFDDGGNQSPRALAVSPDGRLLALASADDDRVRVYRIDRATGALTAEQDLPVGDEPRDLTWSLDGRVLYVANFRDASVSIVDRADDDVLSLRGSIFAGVGLIALHLDSSGEQLYAAGFESDTVEVLGVAPDGSLTRLDSAPAGTDAGPAALESRPTWVDLD